MTAYVRLPGTSTARISTVDSAALSLLGDLDNRYCLAMDDWTPAAAQTVAGHWVATGNQRSWHFTVNTDGTLLFQWSVTGSSTTISATSTAATGFTDLTAHWVRVTHDVDNGAAGNDVAFYTSNDPVTTAPGSVSWTQLGTTITTAGTTSHFNSTGNPSLGAISLGQTNRIVADFYIAELRSSIGGTIVGSPDFRTGAQTVDDGLNFIDSQANTWTLNSSAVWVMQRGTATGTVAWAGSTTGTFPRSGSATGTVAWVGTAAGAADHEGSSTGTLGWAGTANGEAPTVAASQGSADGTITWSGTADGAAGDEGSAVGSITWTGTATGATTHKGAAAGTITWSGTAEGDAVDDIFWRPDPVAFTRAAPEDPSPWT